MTDITYDRVQHYLGRLKLNRIAEQLDPLAEQAAKEEWTYLTFLEHILEAEVSARHLSFVETGRSKPSRENNSSAASRMRIAVCGPLRAGACARAFAIHLTPEPVFLTL